MLWYDVQICSYKINRIEQNKNHLFLYQVWNTQVKSNHGIFQVKLPLFNGLEATFSGICLDQITVKFPQYPLKGIVEEVIAAGYKIQGNNPKDLPQLQHSLLGVTQISCWESSTWCIIQKKCSSYQLNSQYTDLGSRMQMVLEKFLVVHTKCSQRLNPGITWTQQHFHLISISCSKQVTKSTQMHLYYMWKLKRIVSIISWSVKRMKMK